MDERRTSSVSRIVRCGTFFPWILASSNSIAFWPIACVGCRIVVRGTGAYAGSFDVVEPDDADIFRDVQTRVEERLHGAEGREIIVSEQGVGSILHPGDRPSDLVAGGVVVFLSSPAQAEVVSRVF